MKATLLLCVVCLCAVFAQDLSFKNLAGPPSEFGDYVLPTPQMNSEVEDSAAYYIYFSMQSDSTVKATQNLYVDSTTQFIFAFFSPYESQLTLTLTDPKGKNIPLGPIATVTNFPIGDQSVTGTAYSLQNPTLGKYTLQISSVRLDEETLQKISSSLPDCYIISYNQNAASSHTFLTSYALFTGEQIGVVTTATETPLSYEEIKAGKLPQALQTTSQAVMVVVFPDGTRFEVPMHDDGQHNDLEAGDGHFGATVPAPVPGQYVLQASVTGTTSTGATFQRTTEQLVPVIDRAISLAGVATGVTSGTQMTVSFIANAGSRLEQYRAYAEVWGTDANGNAVPVCWIGGMTDAVTDSTGTVSVPLQLDLNWLSRVGATEPLTLKNVIVQDPETFIPFDTVPSMPLKTIGLSNTLALLQKGQLLAPHGAPVTEQMRKGIRPAHLRPENINMTAGSAPVILVHGYCSDVNPFSVVANQFTNAKFFLNAKANLDHDAFARQVASFAGTGPWSYIGHSQGGCVGLHLAHYYWTGMDAVTGGRLVQSVGTPYKGCGAAGTAADLGKLFGVGCGGTNDLTKDGAALWLATISAESRTLVYYWTTTYEQGNFFGDYCNLAMNLVLSWPNDGISEFNYAQLPNAKNMGNTQKWCHSVGMKYTAQTQDPVRNADMNANAARNPIATLL